MYGSFLIFYLHKACLKFSTEDDLIEEASELKNVILVLKYCAFRMISGCFVKLKFENGRFYKIFIKKSMLLRNKFE